MSTWIQCIFSLHMGIWEAFHLLVIFSFHPSSSSDFKFYLFILTCVYVCMCVGGRVGMYACDNKCGCAEEDTLGCWSSSTTRFQIMSTFLLLLLTTAFALRILVISLSLPSILPHRHYRYGLLCWDFMWVVRI